MPKFLFFFMAILISEIGHCSVASSNEEGEQQNRKAAYLTDKIDGEKQKFYYASDGSCGVLEGTKYIEPKIPFPQMNEFKCLTDYYSKIHVPMCGDPFYDQFKHCSMVKFFDNHLPDKPSKWTDENKDLLLVLVNGCVICDQNVSGVDNLKVDVRLKWTWPAGSLFTTCKVEEREAENSITGQPLVMVDNDRMLPDEGYSKQSYGASFVVSGTFYQRFCKGLFSTDDLPTSYQHVKLVVEHNCGGEGKKFELKLPDLVTDQHKLHVAEMRGLALDLLKGTAKLYDRSPGVYNYVSELKWNNWEENHLLLG